MAVKQYIALANNGYTDKAYGPDGLETLSQAIEEDEDLDVDAFDFYEVAKKVQVKLEKKLILVEA